MCHCTIRIIPLSLSLSFSLSLSLSLSLYGRLSRCVASQVALRTTLREVKLFARVIFGKTAHFSYSGNLAKQHICKTTHLQNGFWRLNFANVCTNEFAKARFLQKSVFDKYCKNSRHAIICHDIEMPKKHNDKTLSEKR